MTDVSENFVEVNGLPCRVWEKGEGKPLYYLAGVAGLPRWTKFLDRLAEKRRVVAPSLPGFPGGQGHDLLDSHYDWVTAALDLLERAGMENGSDLIGASVGGAIAAEVAAVSPALVRRLVLIAPFGLYDSDAPPADIWAQRPGTQPAIFCKNPDTFTQFTAPPDGADQAEWSIVSTRAMEATARILWPLGDTRLVRRLHRVRADTLVVWGDEDKVLAPSYAEHFGHEIAGRAAVAVIPGAGHLADLDNPDLAAQFVSGFVNQG
ncbi:MAG TPA: alpha/beta fold hydrolase [Stellaceae bacterium]|jgi:pimeloyl-ACP methyl ester carboxylesterase